MFTDFVCFQFYFRDYVAQPCSQIGTAYICSSIKVLSRNAQRRIFVDCAGVRFINFHKISKICLSQEKLELISFLANMCATTVAVTALDLFLYDFLFVVQTTPWTPGQIFIK